MNPNLTEIAYILDRSGSMQPLQEAAIAGFNDFLRQQLDVPGDVAWLDWVAGAQHYFEAGGRRRYAHLRHGAATLVA